MTRSLRTERFGLVLSEQERTGLRYLAELEGLAEANVMRRMLRLAINGLPEEERQAMTPCPQCSDHLLSGAGLNRRQAARLAVQQAEAWRVQRLLWGHMAKSNRLISTWRCPLGCMKLPITRKQAHRLAASVAS